MSHVMTILEIARVLNVSKSTARRYLEKIGAESVSEAGVKQYDESVVERIKAEIID